MDLVKSIKTGLNRNITMLGVVSGLTDISSEMLYPVMPIFLTSVLMAPMRVVGLIEGVAEATASFVKIFGGIWSDRVKKRKPFVVLGYSLSSISKPLIALAFTWHFVLFARFIDRLGKGLRTSPRDALVAASVDKQYWGKAFGFHRAMDTAGAALGPLVTLFLLNRLGLDYRTIFFIAFVPAALGVLTLALFVKEYTSTAEAGGERVGIRTENVNPQNPSPSPLTPALPMTADFKIFVLLYAIFAAGNSSDVFLIMKAKNTGFTTTHVILAYTGYNILYAIFAMPAGWISDHLGKIKTMAFGFFIFTAVYAGFALTHSKTVIWLLFLLYGFYGAFTEGVAKAVVSHLSSSGNRATAMGYFQGALGFLTFFASVTAGFLWDKISPAAPFLMGSVCALLSAATLTIWFKKKKLAF
ncbi:MAG: MFS transporter [Elusimicrobia bacterium]|nr:MFS transporter [Elusimicrobiota bacterium]